MTNAKHTPEPLTVQHHNVGQFQDGYICDASGKRLLSIRVECSEEQAARIVSCVNACAGIADPEAALPVMRHALDAIRSALAKIEDCPPQLSHVIDDIMRVAHHALAKAKGE